MSPLVGVMLTLLVVCAVGIPFSWYLSTFSRRVSRKYEELTDDRVAMRKLAADDGASKPRLLAMSEEQRADAQRKLITARGGTHAIEFIATTVVLSTETEVSCKGTFVREVENSLKEFFPLGGHLFVLPSRESSHGTYSLHVVAYMETKDVADAHELAQHICRGIAGKSKSTYRQVTFFPVIASRESGDKPGLWTRRYTNTDEHRRYFEVVKRDTSALPDPVAPPRGDWGAARDELLRVSDEFMSFEMSPVDVALTRRLLWDLTEPSTARFYEAFDAANMLLTGEEPADEEAAGQFIEASRVAVAAWTAADRNARDKAEQNIVTGNQVLTEDRAKHRDTAEAAMTLALNPASTDSEAGTAWVKALEALSRAELTVPASKLKKLESNEVVARALRALPVGEN